MSATAGSRLGACWPETENPHNMTNKTEKMSALCIFTPQIRILIFTWTVKKKVLAVRLEIVV
jgi:hypothetical protein